MCKPFQRRSIIASAGDLQRRVVEIEARERPNHRIDPLVLLESTQIDEQRLLRALGSIGSQGLGVDAVVDDANRISRDSSSHEIVSSALANRLKRNVPIKKSERAFGQPDCGCQWWRCFAESCTTEKMVYERDQLFCVPQRRIQRDLIQILNDDIVALFREVVAVMALRQKRVGMSRSDSVNVDPIELDSVRYVRPAAAQQIDAVPASDDSTEDLF